MLYLSRLALNPRARQVQSELRDPYEMHRTLSKAFGEGEDAQAAARCLFRVEESPHGLLSLLVQSRTAPAWDRLSAPIDYFQEPPQVKPFAPTLRAGQPLAFRLRANPTKREATPLGSPKQGRRVGLYTDDARLAWLARKASESGFALCSVTQASESPPECQAKAHRAVFSAVRFEGVLRVTDPERLLSVLEGGVGAGKGFGFGLLSLAPVK